MSEYGYLPESPEQSFGNNKGIFTPKDIYDLTRADKYTNYGQLEFIETQTVSTVSTVNFTNLGDYNVHYLTINNLQVAVTNTRLGVRFYESGVLETATVYQWAYQQCLQGGGSEFKATSHSSIPIQIEQPINFGGGGYNYFYNLIDSSKFSFLTNQHIRTSNAMIAEFGGGLMPQASQVTGFQIGSYDSSNNNFSLTASLYGIRFS
jgi:hypothetical protein